MRLEFFFDCSSPWTYLAFAGIQPLAARVGVSIEWKPILVGGVFNSVNPEVYSCLLYTSDAADERSSVDLGGRRIIKKKKHVELS